MAGENFEKMRTRVLRDYKRSIVRSAKMGHKAKGRGMVLVRLTNAGKVHLSYLTLEGLRHQHTFSGVKGEARAELVAERVSNYSPDSEVLVMVTDGKSERFSLGVKRSA